MTQSGKNSLQTLKSPDVPSGKKKLQPWIVTSKDIDFVTGEDAYDTAEQVHTKLPETVSNGKVKSKRAKRKEKKNLKGRMENNNSLHDDGDIMNSGVSVDKNKKRKRMKKKKDGLQDLNEREPAADESNNGTGVGGEDFDTSESVGKF